MSVALTVVGTVVATGAAPNSLSGMDSAGTVPAI
jgi:hypothetical protein